MIIIVRRSRQGRSADDGENQNGRQLEHVRFLVAASRSGLRKAQSEDQPVSGSHLYQSSGTLHACPLAPGRTASSSKKSKPLERRKARLNQAALKNLNRKRPSKLKFYFFGFPYRRVIIARSSLLRKFSSQPSYKPRWQQWERD